MITHTDEQQVAALQAAAALYSGAAAPGTAGTSVIPDVLGAANALLAFFTPSLVVTFGTRTYQQGTPAGDPAQFRVTVIQDGGPQLKDTEQVTATVSPEDSKGQATVDTNALAWTIDDPAVATLQPAADGMSCLVVGGLPGNTFGHVSDGTLTGDFPVQVTPGDAATLQVGLGAPVPQTPPAGP